MKKLAILSAVVITAALGAAPADAGSRAGFVVPVATEVGGVTLEPGAYRLDWQGAGPAVRLSFVTQGRVVATTYARVQVSHEAANSDAMMVVLHEDGTATVQELRLADAKLFITLPSGEARLSSLTPANASSSRTAIRLASVLPD